MNFDIYIFICSTCASLKKKYVAHVLCVFVCNAVNYNLYIFTVVRDHLMYLIGFIVVSCLKALAAAASIKVCCFIKKMSVIYGQLFLRV